MSWRDLVLRLCALVAPRRVERDLDDELAFHVEMATRNRLPAGNTCAASFNRTCTR